MIAQDCKCNGGFRLTRKAGTNSTNQLSCVPNAARITSRTVPPYPPSLILLEAITILSLLGNIKHGHCISCCNFIPSIRCSPVEITWQSENLQKATFLVPQLIILASAIGGAIVLGLLLATFLLRKHFSSFAESFKKRSGPPTGTVPSYPHLPSPPLSPSPAPTTNLDLPMHMPVAFFSLANG